MRVALGGGKNRRGEIFVPDGRRLYGGAVQKFAQIFLCDEKGTRKFLFDFEKCFQRFKNKCRGEINYALNSSEVDKAIYDWQDKFWEIYPPEMKALKDFNLKLFIDNDGRVFAVEFSMPDEAFQKLEGLPENMLKNFYQNLIKQECTVFKELDFHVLNSNKDFDSPKYTTIWLKKDVYDMFGTFNPFKEQMIKEKEARMKSQEEEQ